MAAVSLVITSGPSAPSFLGSLGVPQLTVAHTKAVFDADVADVIGSMQLLLEACEEVLSSVSCCIAALALPYPALPCLARSWAASA